MPVIEVKNLHKTFKRQDGTKIEVLRGIDTSISKGEKIAVIGPSGSGKSTFLRCLNRMEEPTGGEIFFNGEDITKPACDINLVRRKMGMVFQHFYLFPHLTVRKNLTLSPVELKIMTQDEADAKAQELLSRVGLKAGGGVLPTTDPSRKPHHRTGPKNHLPCSQGR